MVAIDPKTLISSNRDRSRQSGTPIWGWNEAGADLECEPGASSWPPAVPTSEAPARATAYRSSVKQADEARKAGDFDSAIPLYGRALQANPNGVEAKLGLARPT